MGGRGRAWRAARRTRRAASLRGFGFAALEPGGGDEGTLVEGAKGGGEELTQTSGGGLLAVERRQADDAVFVGEGFQPIGAKGGAIGEATAGLARPAVAEQAGDGDVERLIGALGWPLKSHCVGSSLCGLGRPLGNWALAAFRQRGRSKGTLTRVCHSATITVDVPTRASALLNDRISAIGPQRRQQIVGDGAPGRPVPSHRVRPW